VNLAGVGLCIVSGDVVYLDSFTVDNIINIINNIDSSGLNESETLGRGNCESSSKRVTIGELAVRQRICQATS
jgi:hypothetical protein